MINALNKNHISSNCCLLDINGDSIKKGTIVEDELGFKYKFQWSKHHQEWNAVSLKEDNKKYFMDQERVIRNKLKILN